MANLEPKLSLLTTKELCEKEEFLSKFWNSFNYLRSLTLGLKILHPTRYVFKRDINQEYIL
jgi:hypothetical protein